MLMTAAHLWVFVYSCFVWILRTHEFTCLVNSWFLHLLCILENVMFVNVGKLLCLWFYEYSRIWMCVNMRILCVWVVRAFLFGIGWVPMVLTKFHDLVVFVCRLRCLCSNCVYYNIVWVLVALWLFLRVFDLYFTCWFKSFYYDYHYYYFYRNRYGSCQ